MPTLAGLRRRGVPAAAIRDFCDRIGVTKQDNLIEMELLDFCIRRQLESSAPRGMAVRDPLPVTITNYPDANGERLTAAWHPQQPELGERELHFGPELFIERSDFEESPPPKYKRLSPGELVRLRYGYIIRCDEVLKDADGEVIGLRCSYVPESRSGSDTSGLKPKGVVHWVSASAGVGAELRDYGRLFTTAAPDRADLAAALNPDSLTRHQAVVEPAVVNSDLRRFQFERLGYYARDSVDEGAYNRVVSLRDSYKPSS